MSAAVSDGRLGFHFAVNNLERDRVKAAVIKQTPSKFARMPKTLQQELLDLKAAYDAGAINNLESENAKVEITKRAK
jgi:hypothetical protein